MTISFILILLARRLQSISFGLLMLLVCFHIVPAYFGFQFLHEDKLVATPITFLYYYVVTSSSIGYGDLSPSTELGRLFATLYLIPFGFLLFGTFIAKVGVIMAEEIRSINSGLGDFSTLKNHLVVVGYVPGKTERLISEVRHDYKHIVLIVTGDKLPPIKDVSFVTTNAFSSIADLNRSGIVNAHSVVVMASTDQETLLASMAVESIVGKDKHVVAHFENADTAAILESNCNNIETVSNNSVEQLGRALVDPGSSHVIENLVSLKDPISLRSMIWNNDPITVEILMYNMLYMNATLVGYGSTEHVIMSLFHGATIQNGDRVFYIADRDIEMSMS